MHNSTNTKQTLACTKLALEREPSCADVTLSYSMQVVGEKGKYLSIFIASYHCSNILS
jgi:hypothetical protein